ncbi:MAG: DNA internalization-related competence protein ComEC/Rec2 [Clostridia bacterium]
MYIRNSLYYLCAFLIGIVLCLIDLPWAGLLSFSALCCLFFLWSKKYFTKSVTLLCLFFTLFGFLLMSTALANTELIPENIGRIVTIKGIIVEPPDISNDQILLLVKTEDIFSGKSSKCMIRTQGKDSLSLSYNDQIAIRGKLEPFSGPRNPGEFDYKSYMFSKGIICQMNVEQDNISLIARHEDKFSLLRMAYDYKISLIDFIYRNINRSEANLFISMFFGEISLIDQAQKDAFANLGIMHILAVSGSNITVFLSILLFLFIIMRIKGIWQLFFISIFLGIYTIMIGFTPSALRAVLMAIILLLTKYLYLEYDLLASWSLTALILLIWNPLYIYQSGFILSFAVTLGLIIFIPCFNKFMPSAVSVCLAAQLVSIPLSIYYFNKLPLWSFLLNLFFIPALIIVITLGGVVFILYAFTAFATIPLLLTIEVILKYSIKLLLTLNQAPIVYITAASPNWFILLSYFLLIFFLYRLLSSLEINKKAIIINILLCLLPIAFMLFPPSFQNNLEIIFLDVGQGDAIFMKTPKGKIILVDGGGINFTGENNKGEKVILPFLARKGIRRIDLVISTHPDSDHLAGLQYLLGAIPVTQLIIPPESYFNGEYDQLEMILPTKTIMQEVKRNDIIAIDGVELRVLNPAQDMYNDNNNSICLSVSYEKMIMLLTGDIELMAMDNILEQTAIKPVTILKLPHHGSINSFNKIFYENFSPQITVVSVGKNSYGHPANEILEYLKKQGSNVLRTDINGAITITVDKKNIIVTQMIYNEVK